MEDFVLQIVEPEPISLTQTNLVVIEPEIDLEELGATLDSILGV